MPLVYIILVNYNSKIHTLECINSLQKITYNNYKIIVVDNASVDNCQKEVTTKYPDVIWLQNIQNLGFAEANNIGIGYAINHNTKYVLLLNNDTIVEADFLNKLIECYKIDSKIGLVTSKILCYYDSNYINYAGGAINYLKGSADTFGYNKPDSEDFTKNKYCTFASGCCMLLEVEKLKKIGVMSTDYFLYYEDTDYCLKINKIGLKIFYCGKAIIYHKESVTTKKKSPIFTYYLCRNRLIFIKKNIKYPFKIISYIYSFCWMIKKVIVGQFDFSYMVNGILDFLKNRCGKREIF